jgi:hypothetical protein
MAVRIIAPRFGVLMEDGEEWEVQADNRDITAYDMDRSTKLSYLPENGHQAAPLLWSTYLAWHASQRTGHTKLTWPQFQKQCVSVEPMDGVGVGPTQPAPEGA